MSEKYFKNCFTLEDLKKEYKRLLFLYHPDNNANGTEECQKINAEYDIMFEKLKNTHRNANNETYTTNTDSNENVNEFKDILNLIIHFDGIKIEIIGSWIWITGNTFPYRKEFNDLGFKWSGKKFAWYYHKEEYKKHNNNLYNMDEIRNMFGTNEVEPDHKNRYIIENV